MKRTIKFKAKHNGKWIEGFVQVRKKTNDAVMWIENEHGQMTWLHIDIETICQFTGLLDKDGKEIFENDVLSDYTNCDGEIVQSFNKVYFDSLTGQWMLDCSLQQDESMGSSLFAELDDFEFTITSNIHNK